MSRLLTNFRRPALTSAGTILNLVAKLQSSISSDISEEKKLNFTSVLLQNSKGTHEEYSRMEFKSAWLILCVLLTLVVNLEAHDGIINRLLGSRDSTRDVGSSQRFPLFREFASLDGNGLYNIKKNGSSMGINVLSGLVKVDRVRGDPTRPGALLVRVLGMPLFNRGFRPGDRRPSDEEPDFETGVGIDEVSPSDDREEELPLDP